MSNRNSNNNANNSDLQENLLREIDKVIRDLLKREPQSLPEDRPRRRHSQECTATNGKICPDGNCA